MKYLIFLLLLASMTVAFDPRTIGTSDLTAGCEPPPGTDLFELNIINTYSVNYAIQVLGMDDADDAILFAVNETDSARVVVASADDMTYAGEFMATWADPDPFGVAYISAGGDIHVNDFTDTSIHHGTNFSQSYANPYGESGRGMDFDGIYIWEADGPIGATNGAVGRFMPDGSGFQSWVLPGITTQLSGMTLYPLAGTTGIAVTTYSTGMSDHYIWFYEFTGSEFILLGSAEMPSCDSVTGLAYSPYTGTWFASCNSAGDWTVIEFTTDVSALEQNTWGAIKNLF